MSTVTGAARRLAVGSAVAPLTVTAVALAGAVLTADADARFGLPNGKARGDGVTIVKTGERVRITQSLAANGAGRTAWVSGKVKVLAPGIDTREAGPNNGPRGEDASPGSNGTSTTGAAGTLSVGYLIGCQVDIGQVKLGLEGAVTDVGFDGAAGQFSIALAPGRIVYAQLEDKQLEEPGDYFFDWRNAQLEIQGCGGYAQARSYVTVEVTGEDHQKILLWGKPFSIG